MMRMMGAVNTRGFSSCVSTGVLPPDSHITYEGVFNELKFDVGPKTQKTLDCHFGYARYQFSQSLYDKEMNDYLCLFLKSQRDGAQRNDISLNSIICLDISGSMSGSLENGSKKSRIELSIEAIKMFISKLRPNDSVGMILFNTGAKVVFEPMFKRDFDEKFFAEVEKQQAGGGTAIASGLVKSKQLLSKFIQKNQITNSQNRIIMLTDVGDNSIAGSLQFVEQASKDDNIHLTIVGISNQFKSETCDVLKNVKGFNYFCAVNDQDIKKHIFQQFNFNFLPVAHNIEILLENYNIQSFQTFGAPDSDQVKKYNNDFMTKSKQFVLSKTKTIFPSQIEIKDEKVFTYGGVILIKLKKRESKDQFKGTVRIRFETISHQINEQCLRQALEGYAFTSEIKNLIRKVKEVRKQQYEKYLDHLNYLQKIAPESKKNDIESIRKILQNKQQAK